MHLEEIRLRGKPASPGIGIGSTFIVQHKQSIQEIKRVKIDQILKAIEEERKRLQEIIDGLYAKGSRDEALILEAQLLVLEDPTFEKMIEEALDSGKGAGEALRYAAEKIADMICKSEYMKARRADIIDLAVRITNRLIGRERPLASIPPNSVILADELYPSETASMNPSLVAGIATERGGATAHAAIIARNYGIPAVVGVKGLIRCAKPGVRAIVDGIEGVVVINPTPETLQRAMKRKEVLERVYAEYARIEEVKTRDGVRVYVEANIGCADDVEMAVYYRADGVGLLRTEFLFLGREEPPSEDEQLSVYREIISRVSPNPVVIRLLDVGGDKPLPYLRVEREENPFLGVRGIRLLLRNEKVLRTQLRAALRATAYGNVWIMAPMVSTIEEIRTLRRIVEEEEESLRASGIKLGSYKLGIMIETPSAALMAKAMLRLVDFASIGTNDLTQYTLAADRCNAGVASIYDHAHPAVLRLVKKAVEAAESLGKPISVCGEAASDPEVAPILVGLGVRRLSVAPHQIPIIKYVVTSISVGKAKELAESALSAENASSVRALSKNLVPPALKV